MWDPDDRLVGWYSLTQECLDCGALSTAPTPIDDEGTDCD